MKKYFNSKRSSFHKWTHPGIYCANHLNMQAVDTTIAAAEFNDRVALFNDFLSAPVPLAIYMIIIIAAECIGLSRPHQGHVQDQADPIVGQCK